MSFSKIAFIYDYLNDVEVYEQWLDFTLAHIDNPNVKVLDVACGTGWFTYMLQPFVKKIIGVDIDSEMIAVAKERLDGNRCIEFKIGDMLDMQHYETDFDLVTCYLDSICFLEDESQVRRSFKEIYQRLNSTGKFLFDVWTPFQMSEGFSDFNYSYIDDEVGLIWHSQSMSKLKVEHYLTLFQKKETCDLYERIQTTLREQTYPLELYFDALENAGFKRAGIQVYPDFNKGVSFKDLKDTRWQRWVFACTKLSEV